jgi:D-alanyl-D-alanine carboxypeptidase
LTGQPIEQVFQQRIFTPLGMSQTEFPARPAATIPAPYAQGYMLSLSSSKRNFSGKPINVTTWNPSWSWTAGSAISTLHDMEIWAKALATGQLLSPAMQKERLVWGTNISGKPSHGLAIADFSGFIGYNGQIPGYQSFASYMPGRDETIVVLTNLYAAPDGSEPADNLAKIIVHALAA